MDGAVTSYLVGKGYGFIRGDDGRDYFLHQSDLARGAVVIEGQRVAFEESATPKGYRARKVRAVALDGSVRYEFPSEVILARADVVRGWSALVTSQWCVRGSGRGAPDAAKDELCRHARLIGANSVLGVRYCPTTGSEAGTGRGTHNFTIHNFEGRPVVLGRASTRGESRLEELGSIDVRAAGLKATLVAKTVRARQRALSTIGWIWLAAAAVIGVAAFLVAGGILVTPFVVIVAVIASVASWRLVAKDYDGWLLHLPKGSV